VNLKCPISLGDLEEGIQGLEEIIMKEWICPKDLFIYSGRVQPLSFHRDYEK
jgi:hypothetical protein